MYTDGSKKGDQTGAGVVIRRQGRTTVARAFPNEHPEWDGIYDAELMAIAKGLQMAATEETLLTVDDVDGTPQVVVWTDSQAATQALNHPTRWTDASPLAAAQQAAIQLRSRLAPGCKLELAWIPGHAGIVGNEEADQEANTAADRASTLPRGEYTIMREAKETAWTRTREKHKPGRTTVAIGAEYTPERGRELRSLQLAITAKQTRFRVRWLGGYVYSRRLPMPTSCSLCESDFRRMETPEAHMLLHCHALDSIRLRCKILKGPDDAHDWLHTHPNLDTYLAELEKRKPAQTLPPQPEEEPEVPQFSDPLFEAAIASLAEELSDDDDDASVFENV